MTDLEASADDVRSQFDPEYYRREYPDLLLSEGAAREHFATVGWREGRNPNPWFDVVGYLLSNADVEAAHENPFAHYLRLGRSEGRPVSPAVTPSVVTRRLFGKSVTDWVDRIAPYVDVRRYRLMVRETNEGDRPADPVAHWAFRGWRSGLSPSRGFNTREWMMNHPEETRALVNPLLVWLHGKRSRIRSDFSRASKPSETIANATMPSPEDVALVARELSPRFYVASYPEIIATGMDPVAHYLSQGWRSGYDPNPEFDTSYYLSANTDVEAAGINPFLHYLVSGRKEGRNPSAPGRYIREFIEDVFRRRTHHARPVRSSAPALSRSAERLAAALATSARGVVLSLSHDVYTKSIGGTQIVIADEQSRFNQRKWRYLHIAPGEASLVTTCDSKGRELEVALDAEPMGRMRLGDLVPMLRSLVPRGDGRLLVVHSLLGFASPDVVAVIQAFAPDKSAYWLHDYAPICSGFNLLRNDTAFCNAPLVESTACFVCGYGPSRRAHVAAVETVLAAADFAIFAPSRVAAEIWSASKPGRRATVHPHWRLEFGQSQPAETPRADHIKLAFVGHPLASKGWPACEMISRRLIADPRYRLFHFGSSRHRTPPGTEFVRTEVTGTQRLAMVDNLRARCIDIVLILSPWPETFSFIAHEAAAAGCLILCLANSGNVAALVKETGRGKVFPDITAMLAFLQSGQIVEWVQSARQEQVVVTIHQTGTTATAPGFAEVECAARQA